MGTDPDSDRLGIAVRDDEGRMVLMNGNQTASMLTYYILSRRKELGTLGEGKYVVKTIVTTELITEIAKSFGVPVYNVLTGFKYIAEVVKRNEATGEFVCGGEESYGFNVGQFVRDKDAQVSAMMVAECAAWAADQGMTMYQLLQKIYKEYGYRKEGLVSVVRKGISGAREIQQMMVDLRSDPPKELCGSPVTKVVDYLEPEKTGQPSSNVLQFFDEAGDVVSVRPSGTEPKIKFYFGAKGAQDGLLLPARPASGKACRLFQQPLCPEGRFGGLVVFTLVAAVAVHAVGIEHHLELAAGLLQGVHQQQGVLIVHVVVAGAVGQAQCARKRPGGGIRGSENLGDPECP